MKMEGNNLVKYLPLLNTSPLSLAVDISATRAAAVAALSFLLASTTGHDQVPVLLKE